MTGNSCHQLHEQNGNVIIHSIGKTSFVGEKISEQQFAGLIDMIMSREQAG